MVDDCLFVSAECLDTHVVFIVVDHVGGIGHHVGIKKRSAVPGTPDFSVFTFPRVRLSLPFNRIKKGLLSICNSPFLP